MNRIAVVGSSGSGKTTFSKALEQKPGIKAYHLDGIFWNSDKTHIDREEFDGKLGEILEKDTWIIDGDYSRTYEARFEKADTVFFLDYPLEVCLNGVNSRIGTKRSDMPWIETEFDEEFRQWIISWHEQTKPVLRELLTAYAERVKVVAFTSREQSAEYLDNI